MGIFFKTGYKISYKYFYHVRDIIWPPTVSHNARNTLLVIFLSLGFIVQKLYLFLLLRYLFHNRYIRALPFYVAYTQSSCRKLALANIIERFYDFDEIELAIAVLLTFSHEDFFPGRCKIIEFFYDD